MYLNIFRISHELLFCMTVENVFRKHQVLKLGWRGGVQSIFGGVGTNLSNCLGPLILISHRIFLFTMCFSNRRLHIYAKSWWFFMLNWAKLTWCFLQMAASVGLVAQPRVYIEESIFVIDFNTLTFQQMNLRIHYANLYTCAMSCNFAVCGTQIYLHTLYLSSDNDHPTKQGS